MKLNWFEKMVMNSPIRPIYQRKEARLMLELGGDIKGSKVLEIGCGRGVGIEIIFDLFNPLYVEAFDFDPNQIRLAEQRLSGRYQSRIKLYEGSATKIPSKDNQFDAVFDFGALHHIRDNSIALNEISRVLKPGGQFFFQEILSSLTEKPIVRLLTDHPPEAQFTWAEFALRLAESSLVVPDNSFFESSGRVTGVAYKEGNGHA